MGSRDIHFGAFLSAVAGVLCLTLAPDGAIAARVSYWDGENQIEKRLEHLPADTSGMVSSIPLAERLKQAPPEWNTTLPFSSWSSGPRQTSTDTSLAVRGDRRHEIHPVGLIDDETLASVPSLTSGDEHASSDAGSSIIGPQGVAVPLPSSAWTGFTCLGGLAGFYFLKNVRRLLR